MKIFPALSNKIANMGIVCAVLVTSIHVFQSEGGVAGSPLWFAKGYLGWWGFAGVGVPFFFLISGFFLAGHFGEDGWFGQAVRKRVGTLFVPYVAWCVISLATFWAIIPVAIPIAANIAAGRDLLANVNRVFCYREFFTAFGLNLFRNPAVPAFWYVRMLMLFVLIAPLFRWCLRKPILWFVLTGLAYGVAFPIALKHLAPQWQYFFKFGLSLEGIVYFSLGIVFRDRGLPRFVNGGRLRVPLCVALAIFTMSMVMRFEHWQGCLILRVIGIPFAMLAVWRMIPERRWPNWLVSAAFAVFASHQLIIAVTWFALNRFGIDFTSYAGDSAIWWIAMTFAYAMAGVGFAFVLRRTFPRFASLLFGGR